MTSNEGVTIDIGKVPGQNLTNDDYNNCHYNDDSNGRIDVVLNTDPSEIPGYVTLTYTPRSSRTKITGIKYNGIAKNEFNASITGCKIVTVYYWSGDGDYTDPLVVQLSGEQDKYYTDNNGSDENEWKDAGIDSGDLKKDLDEQNCLRMAHIVDIFKKDDGPYNCSACSQQKITLASSPVDNKYTKVSHDLSSNFVGRLKNDHQDISGISITGNINTVTVYWYPLTGGSPLLIYFSSDSAWIKRVSKKTNYWTPA